jgi:inosine-uridine nucleoside N-ribohydrolase
MKKLKFVLSIFFLFFHSITTLAQPKIIFDTDFGGDADDLGALVMLHNFVDKGECELLGIMCWSTEQFAVSAIDAVNRFYNHSNIPIGTRKDSVKYQEWCYSKPITDKFPYKLNHKNVEDATVLYRKLLSQNKDSSVTIVTVGPLKNIENLIRSEGDSITCLTGKELIEKKVKEFVIMGGQFPSGKWEWNFWGEMPGVTKFVIDNLNVPIVFSGFEVGEKIKTGEVFNSINHNTPLYVGFLHFSNNAPWMKKFYNGKIIDNSTFDQTAVLYAVRNGVGFYWDKVQNGYCKPDEKGGNVWVVGNKTKHSYLKLKMKPEEIAEIIEAFMLGEF